MFHASLVAQMVKNLPAMQKTPVRPLSWKDPLEKGMVTHSNILAWTFPWTPGGLQSMGSQRWTQLKWLSSSSSSSRRASREAESQEKTAVRVPVWLALGFPGGSDGKKSAYNAGDPDLILGSGRSPGKGNGNPLQYSCLKNSMDRGAWQATAHGVAKRVRQDLAD